MTNYTDYIYNKDKTEERLRMVRNSLYGYNAPLSEFICERGVLSDEKIEALADELIGIMVSYGADYSYGMSGAHRRCLQLFIYLVIRAYGGRVETFGDILEAAADMKRSHDSLDELILYETDWQPEDDVGDEDDVAEDEAGCDSEYKRKRYPRYGRGFFRDLDISYEILAGHQVAEEMSREQLQGIWDRYMINLKIFRKYDDLYLEDEYRQLREWQNMQADIMDYSHGPSHGEISGNGGVRPSFRILTEKEQEAARLKETKKKEKWKDSLKDPEKYIKAYSEFRSLFFCVGFDCEGLEEAIIYFLCKEGKSSLTDNEKFLRVHIQLDKAYRAAKKQ